MKIAFGSDHAGFKLKTVLMEHVRSKGHQAVDFGTYSDDSTDYPLYAKKAANAVVTGECDRGMLICGTGIGIGITANKIKGVRCAICSEPFSAKLSREHNDSNMIAVGARVIGDEMAKMIADVWIESEFTGEDKHKRRISMIESL